MTSNRKASSTSSQTMRLGAIIKLIGRTPGITLSGLRDMLAEHGIDITERTLAKDILMLKQEYGLLPQQERLRKGYVLEDMCTLSASELEVVLDAMHVFGVRLSDPEAQKMLDRLNAQSKTPASSTQRRTLGHRNIYRQGSSGAVEQELLAAIRNRTAVSFSYETPRLSGLQKLDGYPLLLVFHERGWYCIVRDYKKNSYNPRRLDRIKTCCQKDGPANEDHLDNLREANYLMNCGWGMSFPRNTTELEKANNGDEIVARFSSQVAGYILEAAERHPKARIRRVKDGSGDVEFRIFLSNPNEFLYWIRSFGAQAWIVAPQSLLEKERTEIRRMAIKYKVI